ncbi:hypothetical protein EYC57_01075 [Xanthomonas oryzae]|nr:hypothetical protein EYC57_01075 [Xanthomonas oryzae]
MICSSEKRFFTSNLLGVGNWTPNQGATQNRGDVGVRRDPPDPSRHANRHARYTYPAHSHTTPATCN